MKEIRLPILKELDSVRVSEAQQIEIDHYKAMWKKAMLSISEKDRPALCSAFYQALCMMGADAKRITVTVKLYVAYEPKGQHQHSITSGEIELHGRLLTRNSHTEIYGMRQVEMDDKSFYQRDSLTVRWEYIRQVLGDANRPITFPEPVEPAMASIFNQQMLSDHTLKASGARAPRRI